MLTDPLRNTSSNYEYTQISQMRKIKIEIKISNIKLLQRNKPFWSSPAIKCIRNSVYQETTKY